MTVYIDELYFYQYRYTTIFLKKVLNYPYCKVNKTIHCFSIFYKFPSGVATGTVDHDLPIICDDFRYLKATFSMKMFYLVVLCSLVLVCLAGKPPNQPRSSVPVPFRRSRSVNGLLFQGTMRKILREMKTSFCSELESVALQVKLCIIFLLSLYF